MVRLDLTDAEAQELSEVLNAQLHGLRYELTAADVREFKHELRERLDRLEQIATRLADETAQQLPEADQPYIG